MTFQNASVAGPDRRRWLALAVVLTASFMDLVDATIVNIAIPSIQQDTGASFGAIQWITAGYALAFAIGLITGGRLGDIYGRKRIFLLGVGGFTVASLLCGIAADPAMLVGSRVLQGLMAALMVPQVLSIIHVTFPAEERGKVFGMFGAVAGLGAVSGPMIGALLTEWDLFGLGWRPIFLINLPVGIAGLVLGRRYITESTAPDALRLDLRGVLLATAALLMLLYPITMGHENDWPAWGFVSMAVSLPVFAAFVAYQKRKQRADGAPLVELSLFRVKSFAAGIGVQLAFSTGLGIFFLVWTLYMQLGLGWSALHAGLTGLPFSLACSVAAGMSVQKLTPRFGRKVLHAGAATMAAGALLYLAASGRYGTEIATWQMALPLTLLGGGMGLIFAPLTDTVLSGVPRQHAGSASGLINTTNQLGMALGLGLVSVVFFGAMDEPTAPREAGPAFAGAFENAMWWVIAILGVVYALVFALPKRTGAAVEAEAGTEPVADAEPKGELVGV